MNTVEFDDFMSIFGIISGEHSAPRSEKVGRGKSAATIAHVRGGADRFPDRPFGSVFVRNLARELWAVESLTTEDETDPDLVRFGPAIVALELRNTKRNRGQRFAPQFLTLAFNDDGSIDVSSEQPAGSSLTDVAYRVLAGESDPLTVAALVKAIKEDTGRQTGEVVMRTTLERHHERFTKDTSARPHRWTIR